LNSLDIDSGLKPLTPEEKYMRPVMIVPGAEYSEETVLFRYSDNIYLRVIYHMCLGPAET
jgi:hypothetical protein